MLIYLKQFAKSIGITNCNKSFNLNAVYYLVIVNSFYKFTSKTISADLTIIGKGFALICIAHVVTVHHNLRLMSVTERTA